MFVCVTHTQNAAIRDNFQASRLCQDYLRTFLHKGHEPINCKIIEKQYKIIVYDLWNC